MKAEVAEIKNTLYDLLTKHTPPLQVRVQTDTTFEVAGTKPGMQGNKKVDGYYFATVMPKPKDVRLYFSQFIPIAKHLNYLQRSKNV